MNDMYLCSLEPILLLHLTAMTCLTPLAQTALMRARAFIRVERLLHLDLRPFLKTVRNSLAI